MQILKDSERLPWQHGPNWEKVYIEAAIAAMAGYCANPAFQSLTTEEVCECAVIHADKLVNLLKNEKTE